MAQQAAQDKARNARRVPSGAWLGALAVLVAFVMALQPFQGEDAWQHIKSGWLVSQMRGPAHADVYSCTAQGRPWIQHEWFAQYLIYLAWKSSGVAGLVLWRAAGVALAAFLLLKASRRAGRVSWASASLAVALAMCAGAPRFFSRPEIFTLILFAGLMAALEPVRSPLANPPARLPWRRLWLLPVLIMIFWANVHGAWVAGLVWIGILCAAETVLRGIRRPDALPRRIVIGLWVGLALATAATLVNPFGLHIWELPFQLTLSSKVREKIFEWKPLVSLASGGLKVDWAYLLQGWHIGVPVLLLALAVAPRAVALGDWLTFISFFLLACTARRHLPVLMLVMSPVLASQFDALAGRVGRWKVSWPDRTRARLGRFLVAAACVALVFAALGGLALPKFGIRGTPKSDPVKAAQYLRDHSLTGGLFNEYAQGNYLLFANYPENRVFIDGRIDVYGTEIALKYQAVNDAEANWQQVLREYSLHVALVPAGMDRVQDLPRITRMLFDSPDWRLVYWDDNAAIFLEDCPENRDFLKRNHIYSVAPVMDDLGKLASASESDRAKAEDDYRWKLQEDPGCVLARVGLSLCLSARGLNAEAKELLLKAHALRPDLSGVTLRLGASAATERDYSEAERWLLLTLRAGALDSEANGALGTVYLRTGRLKDALRATNKAIALSPDSAPLYWNLFRIHEQLGDLPSAIRAMENVVRLTPDNVGAQEALRRLRQMKDSGKTQ